MTDFTSFRDILKNELKERGMTLDQLAENTEISPRYLRALMESDTDNLPPAPYVRGYLQKIADVLETDFSLLWKQYENDRSIRKSGASDALPHNRFAVRPIRKRGLIIAGVLILLLAISLPSIADFFGKPSLEVSFPQEETIFSNTSHITITGKVGDTQDTVTVNDTEVAVQPDGTFSKDVPLSEGANSFQISAKRFLGQRTTIARNVFYRTAPFASPSPTPEETPEETPTEEPSPSESPLSP
jgi:cytoskeletal protein RodZ